MPAIDNRSSTNACASLPSAPESAAKRPEWADGLAGAPWSTASRPVPFSRPRFSRRRQTGGRSIASRRVATRPVSPVATRTILVPTRSTASKERARTSASAAAGVGPAEALEPRLNELAGPFRPHAEHRPAIAVGRWSAGLGGGQVGARRGDRIFRPEAELGAGGVRREIEPRPDVLAAEIEEGRRLV